EAGRERRRRPPARNEPGDDQHVASALLQEPLRPVDPRPSLLARKQPLLHRPPEPAAERIRRVVPNERAAGRKRDDPAERELTSRRLDSGDDRRGLTGERRENGVADADPEQQRIGPRGPCEEIDEVV